MDILLKSRKINIAIIGSRTFNDYERLKTTFEKLNTEYKFATIVSGGAKGADKLAEKIAEEFQIKMIIFLANWEKHNKKAGILRNFDIINNSDVVLACWDGQSKGTKHAIELTTKLNKKLYLIRF